MKKKAAFLFFGLMMSFLFGQEETPKDTIPEFFVKFEGDSTYVSSVPLDEVYIFGKLKFDDKKERLRYYVLRRKTIKVYPYAKLAAERLEALNDTLKLIPKKSKRKKYTKQVHKIIEDEFSEELKKLTRTEGQILVKLINRQTGNTAFGLVKELRNGWRAFWYNNTAKMFKIKIKAEYHPESEHEDYLIEDILQRAFSNGRLKKQKTVLNYDYSSLSNKWKGKIKTKSKE